MVDGYRVYKKQQNKNFLQNLKSLS
jgi:hypothetical protein